MPTLFDPASLQRQVLLANLRETPTGATSAPASASPGIGPWPYVAMTGGNLADLLTTQQKLRSGVGREAGLLPGGAGANLAVKAGSTAGLLWLLHEIAKTHPTAAKWLGYGDGAAMGAVALHNARVK